MEEKSERSSLEFLKDWGGGSLIGLKNGFQMPSLLYGF